MSKKKRIWKRLFIVLLCLGLLGGITVLGINGHVKKSTADQILSPEEAAALTDVDCILVLGCYVHDMRLQCLEYFGRFYEDGGKPFRPMDMKSKYYHIVK